MMERAVVLSKGKSIEILDLPPHLRSHVPVENVLQFQLGTPLKEIERSVILATLAQVNGDKNKAAEILGVTARTLYRKEAEWRDEGWVL